MVLMKESFEDESVAGPSAGTDRLSAGLVQLPHGIGAKNAQ
jgi:hypothetical protein